MRDAFAYLHTNIFATWNQFIFLKRSKKVGQACTFVSETPNWIHKNAKRFEFQCKQSPTNESKTPQHKGESAMHRVHVRKFLSMLPRSCSQIRRAKKPSRTMLQWGIYLLARVPHEQMHLHSYINNNYSKLCHHACMALEFELTHAHTERDSHARTHGHLYRPHYFLVVTSEHVVMLSACQLWLQAQRVRRVSSAPRIHVQPAPSPHLSHYPFFFTVRFPYYSCPCPCLRPRLPGTSLFSPS